MRKKKQRAYSYHNVTIFLVLFNRTLGILSCKTLCIFILLLFFGVSYRTRTLLICVFFLPIGTWDSCLFVFLEVLEKKKLQTLFICIEFFSLSFFILFVSMFV